MSYHVEYKFKCNGCGKKLEMQDECLTRSHSVNDRFHIGSADNCRIDNSNKDVLHLCTVCMGEIRKVLKNWVGPITISLIAEEAKTGEKI